MKTSQIKLKNSLILLLTAAIWGVAFVAQSVSMDYIGGFTFNAARNLIGAAVLLPVIWFLNRERNRRKFPQNKEERSSASSSQEDAPAGFFSVLPVIFSSSGSNIPQWARPDSLPPAT